MLARVAKYFVVGGISACVDIGFFFVFAKLLGFNYLAVATVGFLIAVPVNYLLSVRFVFTSGARFKTWARADAVQVHRHRQRVPVEFSRP